MTEEKKVTINGQLNGLNEYTNANRYNRYVGAKMKKNDQEYVSMAIRECLRGWHTEDPIGLRIVWYEPNRKRDPDNVFFCVKFILDALVATGTIPNDNQKYVKSIAHYLCVDRDHPRVEVFIETEDK